MAERENKKKTKQKEAKIGSISVRDLLQEGGDSGASWAPLQISLVDYIKNIGNWRPVHVSHTQKRAASSRISKSMASDIGGGDDDDDDTVGNDDNDDDPSEELRSMLVPELRRSKQETSASMKFVNGQLELADRTLVYSGHGGAGQAFTESIARLQDWRVNEKDLVVHVDVDDTRLKAQFGWCIFSGLVHMVLLTLMCVKDGISADFLVSFTTARSTSIWVDSPTGRHWSLLTATGVSLIFLWAGQWAYYLFQLYGAQKWQRIWRPDKKKDSPAPQTQQWQHHWFFWVTNAMSEACAAVMAVSGAAGQIELIGMCAVAVYVALCDLSYSLMTSPFAHWSRRAWHWVYVAVLVLATVIPATSVTLAAMHKAVFYGWLAQLLLKHLVWHMGASSIERSFLMSPVSAVEVYIRELRHAVNHAPQKAKEFAMIQMDCDKVHVFSGCAAGYLREMVADRDDPDQVFLLRHDNSLETRFTWKIIGDNGSNLTTSEAERQLPHRALLKRATVLIALGYVLFLVVALTVFASGVSSQHYYARNTQQYVHSVVSTGLWPVLFVHAALVPVVHVVLALYLLNNFQPYLKDVLYHGVYNKRFMALAVSDVLQLALVAAAVGVTDTVEMVFVCGVCSMAHWFNGTWRAHSDNDMRSLNMFAQCLPWLAVMLRAWCNDGDVVADRGARIIVASLAFGFHALEAVVGAIAIYWINFRHPKLAVSVELAWQALRLLVTVSFPFLIWQLELLEAR